MKIAWVFPGQGAQSVGMGKELFETSEAARRVFARADDALGDRLSDLIFYGPESDLTLTENAQPAILTTSIAALEAAREAYPDLVQPDFVSGHSLGEYSAHVAAGSLNLEDAVRLVRMRGVAMQSAVPAGTGAMAAIMGLGPESVRNLCAAASESDDAMVAPANFNAPGQIVIAGTASGVERARQLVADRKGKAILLKVSAPFHSPLMEPAARKIETELERVDVRTPSVPVVANFIGAPSSHPEQLKRHLVRQVDGCVRWQECVEYMVREGVTHFVEFGPGKVLAGLIKRIEKGAITHSVGDPGSVAGLGAFLATN